MRETRNYYTTSSSYANHATYSGEITIEDFNTYLPNKKRISNQIDGMSLHETIKKEQNKKMRRRNIRI